jgi:hypothetical protein
MVRSLLKKIYNRLPQFIRSAIHEESKKKYVRSEHIPWSTGYSEFKYDYIGSIVNSSKLNYFLGDSLPEKYGYRLDERVVEYPWLLSRIKEESLIVLDAGSVLNFHNIILSEKLKNKKIYICTLEYEGHLGISPSPSYVYDDLRDTCFKSNFFDSIYCISTLEHVGMDNTMLYSSDYTKKEDDRYAYLTALEELSRILKRKGTLYLTVPYGTYKNFGWFHVFDEEMIERAIGQFNPSSTDVTYFKYQNDQWNMSDKESCRDGDFFDINTQKDYTDDYLAGARCVICLELVK